MVNSHKEKQLNCLMKSLSEIDGDLLGDVEPARPMRLVAKKTNRKWQRLATVAAALAVLVTTGVVIRQVLFGGVSDQKYSGYPFVTQRAEGAPADAECAGEYRDSNEGAICVVEALDRDKMLRAGTIAPNVRDAISQLADRSAKPILLSSYSVNSLYSPAGLYQSLTYLERGAGGVTRDELAHFTYGEAISKLSNQNAALSMAADNQNLLPLFVNALIVPRSSESSLIPSFSDASGGQFYTSIYSVEYAEQAQLELILSGMKPSDLCSKWIDSGGHAPSSPIDGMVLLQSLEVSLKIEPYVLQNAFVKGPFHTPEGRVEGVPYYSTEGVLARNWITDESVISEIPVAGGSLYLILPAEDTTPEDLLAKGDVFSALGAFTSEAEHTSVRFPQFAVVDEHDWLGDKGINELEQLFEMSPDFSEMMSRPGVFFSTILQRAAIRFDPSLSSGSASPSSQEHEGISPVIEYNRPFIFVATDEYGLPLTAGIVRDPLR